MLEAKTSTGIASSYWTGSLARLDVERSLVNGQLTSWGPSVSNPYPLEWVQEPGTGVKEVLRPPELSQIEGSKCPHITSVYSTVEGTLASGQGLWHSSGCITVSTQVTWLSKHFAVGERGIFISTKFRAKSYGRIVNLVFELKTPNLENLSTTIPSVILSWMS